MENAREIADAHNESDPIGSWDDWVLYRDRDKKSVANAEIA